MSALASLALTWTTAAAATSDPPPAAKNTTAKTAASKPAATGVDLDLHQPPPAVAAPTPPPPGVVLKPLRSDGPSPYRLQGMPDGSYVYQGPEFGARILPDGTVQFTSSGLTAARDPEDRGRVPEDRDPITSTEPISVGGGPGLHFDATHEYLRRLGKDPARDAKAAFLTGTFDFRMKMALEDRRELRQAALGDLPARLDQLWSDPRLTSSERRHLLHAMRNDLGNDPNNAGARAVLRDFARRHLPAKEAATFR
jgi:hypothetical protein